MAGDATRAPHLLRLSASRTARRVHSCGQQPDRAAGAPAMSDRRPRHLALLSPAFAALLVAALPGQTAWTQIGPSPPGRQAAAVASGGGGLSPMLFGGNPNATVSVDLGDTWTWGGTGW